MDLNRYRQTFRRKVIPSYYNAKAHIIIFVTLEALALLITGLFINWNWWTPFIILASVMQASVVTYFIHRYMLHKKLVGFKWAHKMHHWHHSFYRSGKMTYDELNDVYMLLMPPWLQLVYYFVYLPLMVLLIAYLLPFKIGFILPFVFGLILWYGLYETVHWIEHLSQDNTLMKYKIFNWLRLHHIVHHSELKDEVNFGIVEPSMDYIFGTKA